MIRWSKPVVIRIAVFLGIALTAVACGDFFPSTRQIVSVSINPTTASVKPTGTQQFTATGIMGNNQSQDVTTQVTWTSSNVAFATIDPGTGIATGVAEGQATITAQASGSVKSTATLFVTNIQSIAVTPATATLTPGGQQQYTATATLVDGTTRVVTNQVTWSVSDTTAATIDGTGKLTAQNAGTITQQVTVTATFGSITGTATVTINIA